MVKQQSFIARNRNCPGHILAHQDKTNLLGDGDGNLVKKIKPDGSYVLYIGSTLEIEKNSGGTLLHTTVYHPAGGAKRVEEGLSRRTLMQEVRLLRKLISIYFVF